MEKSIDPGDIGSWLLPKPDGGEPGEVYVSRVYQNQPGPALGNGSFYHGGNHWMIFGGVGASNQKALRFSEVGN
jgi:hypothetical protein